MQVLLTICVYSRLNSRYVKRLAATLSV